MKITFLGVGGATDIKRPNTSILVQTDVNILFDCGYSAVQHVWRVNDDPEFLDAIFVSHQHADHTMGLPALFLHMAYFGRKRPLKIFCSPDLEQRIRALYKMGYPGNAAKNPFAFEFVHVTSGDTISHGDVTLSFAETSHASKNLAIRLEKEASSVCYSGDGDLTDASRKLYAGANLLIHETLLPVEIEQGHASASDVIAYAKNNDVKRLALVHLLESARENGNFNALDTSEVDLFIPEPGDSVELP